VLVSRELTRVAHSRLERAQEQFTVARARVLSGAAVQTDSLQQVLELTQARLEVLRQDLALKVARLQLGRRIGRPVAVDALVSDSMLPPDLGYTDEQLVQLALEQAPQYREARALERSASYALKGQKGAYLPTFNLTGGFTEYDSRFPPSGQGVGSVSLIVTWPLWDRGQREIAIQQAKTNLNVARAISVDLENAASRDVIRAAEAYRISREALNLTQLQLVAAQETFRVQELRYKSGANTILDLLEAQFQLTRAESEAVQSVMRYICHSRPRGDHGAGVLVGETSDESAEIRVAWRRSSCARHAGRRRQCGRERAASPRPRRSPSKWRSREPTP
jgi:outer membrane protein TolC